MKTFMVIAVACLCACKPMYQRPSDVRRVDDVVVCSRGSCSVIFDNGKNGNVKETTAVKIGDVVCEYYGNRRYQPCHEVR